MPRAIALGQLKTRALRLTGLSGSQFDSGSELTDLANTHIPEVLASLSEASPPDYQSKTFQIVTTAGTLAYSLTNYVSDFGWLSEVYALGAPDSSGVQQRLPIHPVNPRERLVYAAPGGVCTVEIEYTPLPPTLTDDNDTIDGLFGYDELVVSLMARDMCIKQRQDFAGIQTKIDELRARISREATNRDKGRPRYIPAGGRYGRDRWWYLPGSVGIVGYRLRADTIELYQPSAMWW